MFFLALFFLVNTGCRPKDAAYIIRSNSVQANDYPDFEGDWKATVPPAVSKTREPYRWDVPKSLNHAIELLQALHQKKGFVKELGT